MEIGEEAFWLAIWTIVASFVLILTLMLTNSSKAADELIAKSSDPVAVACATGYNSRVSNQCMALLARKN